MWEIWLGENTIIEQTRIIERRKKIGVSWGKNCFIPSEENGFIEQQGTVNKRTFVLLNFRSIVVTTIYHYITISFQILNELNVVTLSLGLQLAGLTSWEFTSSHLPGIHFATKNLKKMTVLQFFIMSHDVFLQPVMVTMTMDSKRYTECVETHVDIPVMSSARTRPSITYEGSSTRLAIDVRRENDSDDMMISWWCTKFESKFKTHWKEH